MTHSLLSPIVYFIGAGPGDPDLLTLKAAKILSQADIILYANSLVPSQMLKDVRPDAEIIATGNKTLEEIIPLMVNGVQNNQSVVRLHSGDLSLYSAIYEQIQALKKHNIPFELIPGISAYQAAAAKLEAELTIPEEVQTIILTRMGGNASTVPDAEELSSLASHKASLCLYLTARQADKAQEKLLLHYSPDTPVAICFRVGWEDEKIWVVPLEKMAEITQQEKLIRTTLYIISPALDPLKNYRSGLYHPDYSHLFRSRKTSTIN